jgi:chromosome segregation ATPase
MEKQNLANLKQDLIQAERTLRDAENEVRQAQQALRRHKKAVHDFTVDCQRQEDNISALNDQLEEATPQNGILDTYEEELKDAQEAETQHSNTYQDVCSAKYQLNDEQKNLKNQLTNIDRKLEEAESKIKRAQAQEEKLDKKRFDATLAKNAAVAAVDDAKQLLVRSQVERDKEQQSLEEFTVKASEISRRVPLERGKTTKDLEERYIRYLDLIAKSQKEYVHSESGRANRLTLAGLVEIRRNCSRSSLWLKRSTRRRTGYSKISVLRSMLVLLCIGIIETY